LNPQEDPPGEDELSKGFRAFHATRASAGEAKPCMESMDCPTQSLRHRIEEVQHSQRSRRLSRLLRLRIVTDFHNHNMTLARPMRDRAEASLEPLDLRALATGFYPAEALELVREHVLSVIGDWDHLVRDFPLRLALVQVGHIYGLSSLFGYSLRRAVMRYQLDVITVGPVLAGQSLKEYIAAFGPAEMRLAASVASREAQAVLDERVLALFGDLGPLWDELQGATAALPQGETALTEAIERGEVDSIRITVGDLRQLVLESTAYGFLLGNAEADVDSVHELTRSPSESGLLLFGWDISSEQCILPWGQSFGSDVQ